MIKKCFFDIQKTLHYLPLFAKGKAIEKEVFFQKIQLR